MSLKDICIKLIKESEGFSPNIYKCPVGKNTIGYGRNLDDFPLSKEESNKCYLNANGVVTITEETATEFLCNTIDYIINQMSKSIFFKELSDNRKAVIVDMVYNLGYKKFQTFKKLIKALQEKDFDKASMEMIDSKWFKQVGLRSKRDISIMRNDRVLNYLETNKEWSKDEG